MIASVAMCFSLFAGSLLTISLEGAQEKTFLREVFLSLSEVSWGHHWCYSWLQASSLKRYTFSSVFCCCLKGWLVQRRRGIRIRMTFVGKVLALWGNVFQNGFRPPLWVTDWRVYHEALLFMPCVSGSIMTRWKHRSGALVLPTLLIWTMKGGYEWCSVSL